MSQLEQKARDDFRVFLSLMWQYHRLDEKAALGDLEFDIAGFLQNGPRYRGIIGFRELGKTVITCCYCAWRIYRDPAIQILLVSKSTGHAKRALHLVRNWIYTTPWLSHLVPSKDENERSGALCFDVAGNRANVPTMSACGIEGQLTGGRAHVVIGDDVETQENSRSQLQRAGLKDRLDELFNVSYKNIGEVIYLGTPLSEETVYEHLHYQKGFEFRSWPIVTPHPTEECLNVAPFVRKLAQQHGPDYPTAPHRFGPDTLVEIQAHTARSTFLKQYKLLRRLADSDRHPLKLRDLIVFTPAPDRAPNSIAWGTMGPRGSTAITDIESVGYGTDCLYAPIFWDETWATYNAIKMYIDPAGGTGRDEVAWAVGAELNGYVFILRVGAYSGPNDSRNLKRIVDDAEYFRVNDIYIEKNYGGDMMAQLLSPLLRARFTDNWGCVVSPITNSGQKEARIIDAMELPMQQHRVVVAHQVAQDATLMTQLVSITRERNCLEHEDRLESVAGLVSQFAEHLSQDPEQASIRTEQIMYEQAIADFDRLGAPNKPARSRRWMRT